MRKLTIEEIEDEEARLKYVVSKNERYFGCKPLRKSLKTQPRAFKGYLVSTVN